MCLAEVKMLQTHNTYYTGLQIFLQRNIVVFCRVVTTSLYFRSCAHSFLSLFCIFRALNVLHALVMSSSIELNMVATLHAWSSSKNVWAWFYLPSTITRLYVVSCRLFILFVFCSCFCLLRLNLPIRIVGFRLLNTLTQSMPKRSCLTAAIFIADFATSAQFAMEL